MGERGGEEREEVVGRELRFEGVRRSLGGLDEGVEVEFEFELALASRSLSERRFLRLGLFLGMADARLLLVMAKKPELATLRNGVGMERRRR